jgi:glycerol-3-phosphate acyltransferase PlsY
MWLGFKGGKGVSTYIGVLAALAWPAALVFGLVWAGTAAITRYSSASGLVASLATPFVVYFTSAPAVAGVFAVMTAILWWRHEANIRRLLAGTEGRIGERR